MWSSFVGFTCSTLPARRLLTPVHRPLELCLVHRGATLDAHPLGLVVELLLRPALLPVRAGAHPAAAPGRHVGAGEPRRLAGLARPRPRLVDGAGRDLLRALLRRALLALALLDVLVLPLALCRPCLLRHAITSLRR